MCFSNLPVEFDDDGNPRLVDTSEEHAHDDDTVVERRATSDDGLDPEARYREILDDLPDRVRDQFDDGAVNRREDPQLAE
jgi:hypothetical protein